PPPLSFATVLSCVLYVFPVYAAATTVIYTLSLHDALPIWVREILVELSRLARTYVVSGRPASVLDAWLGDLPIGLVCAHGLSIKDRKSTRLNSSHVKISYAVFCLKKKKKATPAPAHAPYTR